MKKDLQRYFDALIKAGYSVEKSAGGHQKIYNPDGKLIITWASTSRDVNSVRILRGYLQRAGINPAELLAKIRTHTDEGPPGALMKEVFGGPETPHTPYVQQQEGANVATASSDSRARLILTRLNEESLPKLQEQLDTIPAFGRRRGTGAVTEFSRLMLEIGERHKLKTHKTVESAMNSLRSFMAGKNVNEWVLDLISDTCDHVAGLKWGEVVPIVRPEETPGPEPEPEPTPVAPPTPAPVAPGLQERYADTLLTAMAEGKQIDQAMLDRLDKLTGLS